MKTLKKKMLYASAGMFIGMMSGVQDVYAQLDDDSDTAGSTFSTIAGNITTSISSLPGLLSGLSYMMGMLLCVLGILKIKDHVENPGNAPLKDGAIRLAAGGGLFAIPIISQAALNTIGTDTSVDVPVLNNVQLGVTP